MAIEGDGQLTAEATESLTSHYYFAPLSGTGGQRMVMRQDTVAYFIVGDPAQLRRTGHLGTTSLVPRSVPSEA